VLGSNDQLEAMATMGTATLTPAVAEVTDPAPERPHLRAIIRHLSLSILMANVVPSVLFYLCMVVGNVWMALIAALCWCYGAMAWRLSTKRRTSGLLIITMVGLTAKTLLAFASGSTYVYFLQPAITDAFIAAMFLSSLTTARPVVARLAGDFYPMNADIAERPRIQRLFWNLTLFWAIIAFAKAVVTLWLLEEFPLVTFVAVKGIFILATIAAGTAVTLATAFRVARAEGLLHRTQRI
jgi:hypothetical protein